MGFWIKFWDGLSHSALQFLLFLIPGNLRKTDQVFIRSSIVATFPAIYLVASHFIFRDYPYVTPPLWMYVGYFSMPLLLRMLSTPVLPAVAFVCIQIATSVYVTVITNPRYAHGTTALFVPMVCGKQHGYFADHN